MRWYSSPFPNVPDAVITGLRSDRLRLPPGIRSTERSNTSWFILHGRLLSSSSVAKDLSHVQPQPSSPTGTLPDHEPSDDVSTARNPTKGPEVADSACESPRISSRAAIP